FLPEIRRQTSKPVLLLVDNYSGHSALQDPRWKVTIAALPPNCTSRHQPVDQGIIVAFK
ncbi:unnamed protein product, partial [Phaeothamnion confervicola]